MVQLAARPLSDHHEEDNMRMRKSPWLLAMVACAVLGAMQDDARADTIAVFENPWYTSSGTANNVKATLVGLGHTVVTFGSGPGFDFAAAADMADIWVFPELKNMLGHHVTYGMVREVRDWIRDGGKLINIGGGPADADWTWKAQAIDSMTQSYDPNGPSKLNDFHAHRTDFEDGPEYLPDLPRTGALALDTLPWYARAPYQTGDREGATVALFPRGEGSAIFIGWGWNFMPSAGNPWVGVLSSAIGQSHPVPPLPEPGVFVLCGIAALGIAWRRRKQKRNA
jgi:hypothetical protein